MEEKIEAALKNAKFPGFEQDIVTLGMVEEFSAEGGVVTLKLKNIHASDEIKEMLIKNIEDALIPLNLQVKVHLPQAPGAGPSGPPSGAPGSVPGLPPKTEIKGVDRIIPVASGKGGVGKSTVAVNLAIALAKEGKKVGLLDLDVYGPSIPTMMGIEGLQPQGVEGKMKPVEKHGIKTMSIGFLLEKGKALIWRGPMVGKIVKQFFYDVDWGKLDYLLLDLPPGTGDVQITMIQSIPVYGSVVVTTPQNVALADVEKAISMFRQTDARVLGIIENMSGFLCPHCNKESFVFGKDGGKKESEKSNIPLLGQIPLEGQITEKGDSGEPVVLSAGKVSDIFQSIARRVIEG
jgi:ATP-binding protein involved in chromosome partitioning